MGLGGFGRVGGFWRKDEWVGGFGLVGNMDIPDGWVGR